MLFHALNSPPATHFLRPERKDPRPGILDKALHWIHGGYVNILTHQFLRVSGIVSKVARYGKPLEQINDAEIKEVADSLRMQFYHKGLTKELIAQSFALIREVAWRTLNMRHFDSQLMGGWIMIKGMIAEMETGEGKTLTATLAAGTAALAGVPVHVITVNDYLTDRDAEWMGPIYQMLGITVGRIVHGMTQADRRASYNCDVTYCTNKEITFDYLRDWITLEGRPVPLRLQAEYLHGRGARIDKLLLRGLHFALVDEADSVLIDEARTPLIISKATEIKAERRFLEQALELAGQLQKEVDFRVDRIKRKIELTEIGKKRIQNRVKLLGALWTGSVRREEIVRLALMANVLFHRDEHYLVMDGKIQIVDEFTGRVMPDRSYEGGLHQLLEIKENCEMTRQQETQARISYQRFFRRYLHMGGMTGTAKEVKRELWSVYSLPAARIPTHRPLQRKSLPDKIYGTAEAKWQGITDRIQQEHKRGRPVLIGTRSVAASERASQLLSNIGLKHQVLNAKQDKEEAEIISKAGESGCITIATNMAGRGTDIKLGPGVQEKMGLHVILTERHEAGRIDRQLSGRCARQGDPGSHEAILSMEDPILDGGRGGFAAWLARRLIHSGGQPILWSWLGRWAMVVAQKKVERLHARIRRIMLRADEHRGDMLSFSGRTE